MCSSAVVKMLSPLRWIYDKTNQISKCVFSNPKIFSSAFRGGSEGSLEPPSGTKLYRLHWKICEKSGKMLRINSLLMDLNHLPEIQGLCLNFYHSIRVAQWLHGLPDEKFNQGPISVC